MELVKDTSICPFCKAQSEKDPERQDGDAYVLICKACGAIGGTGDNGKNVLWGTKDDSKFVYLKKE